MLLSSTMRVSYNPLFSLKREVRSMNMAISQIDTNHLNNLCMRCNFGYGFRTSSAFCPVKNTVERLRFMEILENDIPSLGCIHIYGNKRVLND